MVNQSLLNSSSRVVIDIADTVDSGVLVTIKNMENVVIESGSVASYDSVNAKYYYDVSASIFDEVGTFFITWIYKTEGNDKIVKTEIDILEDSERRYCYIYDMRRKLGDILLSSSFDLAAYTLRAANELDRAFQGIYVLPLTPDSTHEMYDMDEMSLRELASDIAAGYAMEDINITTTTEKPNMKKVTAFAELNRYVDLKKVFASIPKETTHDDLRYQFATPRVAASESESKTGRQIKDPLDSVYNHFMPRSDRV